MPLGTDLRQRLAAVKWSDYRTAYGSAAGDHLSATASGEQTERWGSIPEQLLALASSDLSTATEASHRLWCCLCHQHAYVSSAALPALPFLLEILEHAQDQLAGEILDILLGFASCSRDSGAEPEEWQRALRARLLSERDRFTKLASHPDSDIADWARRVLHELES